MNTYKYLAQTVYGGDNYNAQSYGCDPSQTCTTQTGTNGAGAPNTGFFGSSDAVFATVGGALLIAIAIVGVITVFVTKANRRKQTEEK